MDNNVSWILSEEGNPFIKRDNQIKRYAKKIWPIPELRPEIKDSEQDEAIGKALAALAFAAHDIIYERDEARRIVDMRRAEIAQEFETEIEGLEEQLRLAPIVFSHLEQERYETFLDKHYKLHNDGKYKRDHGITFHVVGTGIGVCTTLECPVCHEKEDITDIANW